MAVVAVAVVAVAVGVYAATRTVTVPGQKLGDISPQTAKEGEPRLIVWGIVRPIGGNIVAVQEPPRIERRKQKSGGKGGGGSKTTTEHPHRTYAIAICEGPITGIRRVWRNNKLIYDGRPGSAWGAKNNHVFLRTARFFMGGFNQMPSPDLEKVFGVGNVPAMRGTAYMVMADEDLSDMGGAVPQWLFEVVRAEGFSVTSRPYTTEHRDELGLGTSYVDTELRDVVKRSSQFDEAFIGVSLVDGELREPVSYYDTQDEAFLGVSLADGELRDAIIKLSTGPDQATLSVSLADGMLRRGLVRYEDWPTDKNEISVSLVDGEFYEP